LFNQIATQDLANKAGGTKNDDLVWGIFHCMFLMVLRRWLPVALQFGKHKAPSMAVTIDQFPADSAFSHRIF
jgi:hypothetical protein